MLAEEEIVDGDRLTDLDEPMMKLRNKLDETDWSDWRIERPTIFRVHQTLRDVDKEAYQPRVISFGPYHRGNKRFADMEKLKWLYLKKFLTRNPEVRVEDYVMEIRRLEMQARSAYFEKVEMETDEFVEMMLLDGCFIVELLLAQIVDPDENQKIAAVNQFQDPIWSSRWALSTIIHDMLMLENQLPFFLLERLLKLNTPSQEFHDLALDVLMSLILYLVLPNYMAYAGIYIDMFKKICCTTETFHLLHLFHILVTDSREKKDYFVVVSEVSKRMKRINLTNITDERSSKDFNFKSCLPTVRKLGSTFRFKSCSFWEKVCKKISPVAGVVSCVHLPVFKTFCCGGTRICSRIEDTIPSATKLNDAGVKFKRTEKPVNFLDITFDGNELKIPRLLVVDSTNCLLRNLIAFEQCSNVIGDDVSQYAAFMDRLIDTPEDVEILQQNKIIYNGLGSHEDIASLFNQMCNGVFVKLKNSYLKNVISDLNEFCSKRRNRWREKLNRDYFSNPWAIISLLAAGFLLILTVLQTIFALLAYFKPPN